MKNYEFSAILLAGGKSSRMGENKAFLKLGDRTFLDILIDKLCLLGADEIIISGDPDILLSSNELSKPDDRIRIIPDIIKDKGPLGGLYSCFNNTRFSSALVIGIDTPLISEETLKFIITNHIQSKKDATVLTVASKIEPLIAAYSVKTLPVIKKLIENDSLSFRSYLDSIDTCYLEFNGNSSELYNCNTKEEYQKLILSIKS